MQRLVGSLSVFEFLEESFQFRFITNFSITFEYLDFNVAVRKEFDLPFLPRNVRDDHDGVVSIVFDSVMNLAVIKTVQEFE